MLSLPAISPRPAFKYSPWKESMLLLPLFQQFHPEQIFEFMRSITTKHKDADGIYMLGSAWKTLDIIDRLEKATGLAVIHPGPARCWETQLRLGLRHPIPGYGRLLTDMPS